MSSPYFFRRDRRAMLLVVNVVCRGGIAGGPTRDSLINLRGGIMRNKLIVLILVISILVGSIKQEKIESAEVVVTLTTELLIYLVTQSVAGGVSFSDIFTKNYAHNPVTDRIKLKDGNTVSLPGGVEYSFASSFKDSISKNLTMNTLKELTSAIHITDNKMKVDKISDTAYAEMNALNELIRNNPKLQSYVNSDTLNGKVMNQGQLELLKSAINMVKNYNPDLNIIEMSKTYPYYILYTSAAISTNQKINENTRGYTLIFSKNPLFVFCRQEGLTGDAKDLFYSVYNYDGNVLDRKNIKEYTTAYGVGNSLVASEMTTRPFEFWNKGMKVIGNGMMLVGSDKYVELSNTSFPYHIIEHWDRYINEVGSMYYSLPLTNLNTMTIDTYIPYPKDNVKIKENEDIVFENITTLDDIDTYAEYVNVGTTTDVENGRSIDNTDSMVRSGLIDKVIDWDKTDIPGTGETTVDLTQTNERLDKILEKLGELVGTVGNIDALTDSQLREILKDLDLANTDGLTIDQVRDYVKEREKEQATEIENELDLDKYKMDAGIITKFPFCVPFDLIDMLKKLKRTGVAPRFEIPFTIKSIGVDEIIVFDFKDYEPVVVIVRWFLLFSFVASLILVTRKLIRG